MLTLIKGLPREALVRTPVAERGRDPWTAELELMAQLLEVTSIGIAQMKLRKPIKVPRPKKDGARATAARAARPTVVGTKDNPYRAAMRTFGATPPKRLAERQDSTPDGPKPVVAEGSGEYGAAIARFGASQPPRLRAVRDGERSE